MITHVCLYNSHFAHLIVTVSLDQVKEGKILDDVTSGVGQLANKVRGVSTPRLDTPSQPPYSK